MTKPLYQKIRDSIRKEINQGKWAVGESIPSELELSQIYGVSRFTVRQAILELAQEGLLSRHVGKGTFVEAVKKIPQKRQQSTVRHLGFVLPYSANSHTGGILKGAEEAAVKKGFRIVFVNSQKFTDEWKLIEELYKEGVEGIVYYFNGLEQASNNIVKLREREIPFVLVDRYIPDLPTDYVVSDNFQGAYEAVRHLLELDHEKIAMLAAEREISSVRQRLKGYIMAHRTKGVSVDSGLIFLHKGLEISKEALLEVLEHPSITAIFTYDILAARLLKLAYQLKIKIPDSLALVGFDDARISNLVVPPLTTVRQNCEEMGSQVVEILIRKINGDSELQQIALKTELIIRESSGQRLVKIGS